MGRLQSGLCLILQLFGILSRMHLISGLSPDGLALLSLKKSFVDARGRLDDWLESDSTPCWWTGVSCDDLDAVIGLNLSAMDLSGELSADVGRLVSLVNLTIAQNNLTGNLPGEMSALGGLRLLNISHNNFSNHFPANFSRLKALEILDAYNNNFSGPLPMDLAELPNLTHLHLGGSYFDGIIPPQYGNLSRLSYLALSGNSLLGRIPRELGNLTQLQQLYLGYFNIFEGGIPSEIGKLVNLVRLDLSSCGLTGAIPPELGNLPNLDSLFLQINELSGSIPPELGKLAAVKSLDLSRNELTGEIPAELNQLQNLELLSLFLNNMQGDIPLFLGELPNMQVLFLWGNSFTGAIPRSLGLNGNLIKLDLSSNALVGSIPVNLCAGQKLLVLVLLGNDLSGSIPASLGQCNTLNHVRLGSNQLSGSIPEGLLRLNNLQMLELQSNRLTGSLSDHAVNAPLLQLFDASDNQIHGALPPDIGKLGSLQKMFLSDNRIWGEIPRGISELRSLSNLDLSGNQLSGQIPAELGKCTRLLYLDLSVNKLSGEIPSELESLQVLGFLNLSRNHLTGSIPPAFNMLQGLSSVDFSYNNLSGPVPINGQFDYYSASAFAGNPGLCGHAIAPCPHALNETSSSSANRSIAQRLGPGLKIVITGVGTALMIVMVFLLRFACCRKEQLNKMFGEKASHRHPWKLTTFQRLDFDSHHVLECLRDNKIIGKGGNGTVFRGIMPNGEVVAIKKLKKGGNMGCSDDHGFSAEIETLGKIRHRNIVKLFGCCSDGEINLLIYEYMPNGSLGELLHGSKSEILLDWNTRYAIALQAANGLCYLHHDCFPLIVHRDVKSNNILLDSSFQAHVADFGLAKSFQEAGKSASMSSVAGSWGYIAPEYAYTLKVNEKSDIYSFGIVLLELITGRRPNDPGFTADGLDIVHWVRTRYFNEEQGLLQILDPRMLCSNFPFNEVKAVVGVALICCSMNPVERPTMRDVVQMLVAARPKSRVNTFKDSDKSESPLIAI
ncbi:hypothetical protein O6H91_09G088000 [Diphasiastrum complanatum]|uniref:Uncharacterized protein n=1 Tax=Diphasiastrum complanatum TaxID=34168 RepID=A0ACC2CRL0_DIPCM|nr:hypothetical protein O6H91_09G088000 [Diphasiastrum complanatum]